MFAFFWPLVDYLSFEEKRNHSDRLPSPQSQEEACDSGEQSRLQ